MTTIETTLDSADAPAAGLPFDLYREVHKGLRSALFGLTTTLGATDVADPAERSVAVERVAAVIALLHTHHGHEDAFIQPLLVRADPKLAAIVDAGHEETERDILELEQLAARLSGADGAAAVVAGHALYARTALFTAQYLAHMALEEGAVMDALRGAMSDDDLFAVEMELRGSVAPPTMCEFITVMVPAMNRSERAAMLGGMHAGAPAEVFELFRASAEACLAPDAYRTLAADIGIA